jgi:hypothetical protein
MTDYCAVKDGEAFCGTKEEILNATGEFWFDCGVVLYWRVNSYPTRKLHSYNAEWTATERVADAINHMFYKLGEYGFTIYTREIIT